MKALVMKEQTPGFRLAELSASEVRINDVLIRVTACVRPLTEEREGG